MRRGLKLLPVAGDVTIEQLRFKPIPDEEGTETVIGGWCLEPAIESFKPIPDEEGTETCNCLNSQALLSGTLQTDPR